MTEILFARLDEMLAADANLQAQITAIAPIDNASIIGLSLLPTATGFLVETANGSPNTFTQRSILGTTSQIIVSNGDGVVGNPVLSLSSAVIIPGSITLNPTALSNNAGFTSTHSTPSSGSVTGPISLNSITVTSNAQTVNQVSPAVDQWGQITNQINSFRVNTKVTGNVANSFGINSALVATATNGGSAAKVTSVYANSPGNTITGDLWGDISVGIVGPTTNLNQILVAYSAEMLVADTGVVLHRIGFEANSQGPTQGTTTDAAFIINTANLGVTNYLTGAPWKTGFYLSNIYGGAYPIAATGNVILSDTGTVANFISAHTLTVTGNIFDFPNASLTGAGVLRLANVVSSGALIVNANSGTTVPAFTVDTSNGSGNGVYVNSTAAGSGANITTVSSTTNERLFINARGSGTIDLAGTSTGGVTIHGSFTATGLVTNAALNADVFSTAHSWSGGQTFTAPNLGTPASGIATNLTGTASGLTAGNVTTNANLTGDVTSVGNATTLTSATVTAKLLTGYVSGSGTVAATDSILQAIQKLNGNDALKLPLAGGTMSGAIAMGANAITGITSLSAVGAMTFSTNNGTLAGTITTAQKWGIGTETNPQAPLVISNNVTTGIPIPAGTIVVINGTDASSAVMAFQSFGTGQNPAFAMRAARGTAASPSAVQAADVLGFYNAIGYAATAYDTASQSGFYIGALNNHTLTDNTTFLAFLTVPTGTTRSEAMRIVDGLSVGTTTAAGAGNILINGVYKSNVAPTAVSGAGPFVIGSASTLNVRVKFTLNGTDYWVPASTTAY